ncbi:zinc-binding domain-containing protein [Aspergillus karnatakaensis]|uniref:3CxxC-type zinc finger protein n=1 Tax=Aspergillus karnatakaensis TaxID=1810916 RepID=UPI003CCDA7E4
MTLNLLLLTLLLAVIFWLAISAKQNTPKTSSMHPDHHASISTGLASNTPTLNFTFHPIDTDTDCIHTYDTSIMGLFVCLNPDCGWRWSSRKVTITIRMYPGMKYNARVYHQRCRICRWVAQPRLDRSYTQRVVYRLRKWSGIRDVAVPDYEECFDGHPVGKGEHDRELCEGCKAGRCD